MLLFSACLVILIERSTGLACRSCRGPRRCHLTRVSMMLGAEHGPPQGLASLTPKTSTSLKRPCLRTQNRFITVANPFQIKGINRDVDSNHKLSYHSVTPQESGRGPRTLSGSEYSLTFLFLSLMNLISLPLTSCPFLKNLPHDKLPLKNTLLQA
jgi:hypothetical protein